MKTITISYDGLEDDSKLLQNIFDETPENTQMKLLGTFNIHDTLCLPKEN